MRDQEIFQRRASRLFSVDPNAALPERPPYDPEIVGQMQVVAAKRRRLGVILERK